MVIVVSIGLALHLILPQIPGIERSADLILRASPPLVVAAFFAEIASELCYSELLGRTMGAAVGSGPSLRARRRRGIGPWFTFRLTLTGYGAAHVLPGGGAAASTVDYGALRRRGLDPARIALSLAAVAALNYGALGLLSAGSLLYLIAAGDLGPAATAATVLGLALVLGTFLGCYVTYHRPRLARSLLVRAAARFGAIAGPVLARRWSTGRVEEVAGSLASRVREALRAGRIQLQSRPAEAVRLFFLALGYWAFDALCLVLVFRALGVEAGVVALLVAYGVATAAGSLPLTPGGIGVFEATMLGVLALFGATAEAAVAVLGYRLFNFWLPIPLAALFYPTLRPRDEGSVRQRSSKRSPG